MANTFRKNPDWDEIIIKDVNCYGISRTKMDKTWLYATGKVYYTIVKKNNYYGIIARAEKDDEFTGVCACKYESIFPLYVYDEFSDCNYAYFAVMKNKKYGLFRLETSNEISDKIYGREVVSCKYDQITQLETCKPYFNIILLINNRIKTDEYNDEKAYMEISYYNGFTDKKSDIYRKVSVAGCSLMCNKLYGKGYLVNMYDDSLIHKSEDNFYYKLIKETKKWRIFLEVSYNNTDNIRLIFYNLEEKVTYIMDNLKNVLYFSKNCNIEKITVIIDGTENEIVAEDEKITEVAIKFANGPLKFYYQ